VNNKYCIYFITNLLNNKVYVGKTAADTSRRWRDHLRNAFNPNSKKNYIHNAIAKYGSENFKFSIIKYFEMYSIGNINFTNCGKIFDVNRKTISNILYRHTYKEIIINHDIERKVSKLLNVLK